MSNDKRIIIANDKEDINQTLRQLAGRATVKTYQEDVKVEGKTFNIFSEYANLDPTIMEKIGYCIEEGEAFGLSCDDSVVIIAPTLNAALWYGKTMEITSHEFKNIAHLSWFISTLLYTHTEFMGPQTVEIFVTRAKKYIDECKHPEQVLPEPAMPEPPESSGPLETSE